MSARHLDLRLADQAATQSLAARIGTVLVPGDTLLLLGPVGAGKTTFARALIQSILTAPEDIPSPTFTLVQTYDTRRGPLWHSDLYRVQSVFEIEEIGLGAAFEDSICLVEWPEILGDEAPDSALSMRFSPVDEETRELAISWTDQRWDAIVKERADG